MKRDWKIAAAAMSAVMMMAVPAYAKSGTVCADILNVRTAPSTNSDIASTLYWGDTVTITYEPGNGWYEIYTNGGCYYVNGAYVSGAGSAAGSSSYTESGSSYSDTSYTQSYDSYSDAGDTQSYDSSSDTGYTESSSSSDGTYLGTFALTAYCGCAQCCGSAGNLTASGTVPTPGRTVAMGGVPFGTKLKINGNVYTVEDRGTAYGTVDIFCGSHAEACAFGLQYADVYEVY